MVEPRHVHLVATKHVRRYLKGTLVVYSDIHSTVSSYYVAILIQIGKKVLKIEISLHDVVLVWD